MPDRQPDDGPSLEMPSFSLRRRRKDDPVAQPEAVAVPEPEPDQHREPRSAGGGPAAAIVTGLGIGVLAVALTWLSGVACEAARGTSSCGGTAGFPLLLAGLVLLAWVGGVALRALGVAEATSTSVLAVGILAVLVMVFLLGSLDEPWTAVAVPACAVVAYVASWWVTHAVSADDDRPLL